MYKIVGTIFLTAFLTLGLCAQSNVPAQLKGVKNKSIQREGHRPAQFSISEQLMKKVRRHRSNCARYLFSQLSDTSRAISAHFILSKLMTDSMSVTEQGFVNDDYKDVGLVRDSSGFMYVINGLEFRKYLSGRYVIDTTSLNDIRNKWQKVLENELK